VSCAVLRVLSESFAKSLAIEGTEFHREIRTEKMRKALICGVGLRVACGDFRGGAPESIERTQLWNVSIALL
jgi:hypothetical protein